VPGAAWAQLVTFTAANRPALASEVNANNFTQLEELAGAEGGRGGGEQRHHHPPLGAVTAASVTASGAVNAGRLEQQQVHFNAAGAEFAAMINNSKTVTEYMLDGDGNGIN
jgi:hypothetical protein